MKHIRLRVDWSDHEIFDDASEGERLAWVYLLCYVSPRSQRRRNFDLDEFRVRFRLDHACTQGIIERAWKAKLITMKNGTLYVLGAGGWIAPNGRGNDSEWRKIRKRILHRDNWLCRYCGQPAQSVDHVIAHSREGTDDESNLVACCRRCNSRKGAKTLAEAGMTLIAT